MPSHLCVPRLPWMAACEGAIEDRERLLSPHKEPQEKDIEKASIWQNKLVLLKKPIITFLLISKLVSPFLKTTWRSNQATILSKVKFPFIPDTKANGFIYQ